MGNTSSTVPSPHRPEIFKGIALFTPGGDLVYCIDPHKQARWHLHLCALLQELLHLPEPPHFLVPCFSATIDRWVDPKTQQIRTAAEACPQVLRYQALLNAVFDTGDLHWKAIAPSPGNCDLLVLSTYQQQFPQLWENHDLIVRFDQTEAANRTNLLEQSEQSPRSPQPQGYVLRLYVSGITSGTEQILQNLHQLLEESLQQPYTLKVIDVHRNPEQAEADQVSATPTLVKVYPLPVRRMAGDLTNGNRLLQMLRTE